MKAAIYNPYLDTLGGGERYTMAVATTLAKRGYKVDVEWKDISIKNKLEKRFGINLRGINYVPDVKRGDGYDISFWVSDGSIPLLRARKNFLHFQIPFKDVGGGSLINRMKFMRIKMVICNSKFTKSIIDQEYGVKSVVIYPPVDIENFRPKRKKENIILYVGRFSRLTQSKRQDVLIEAYKKMGLSDWKLILAGGVEVGLDEQFNKLKQSAKGSSIEIIESPKFGDLRDLFGKAKIFWSASGYGVDEQRDPMKVEHFGISVVEAMSAGSVPIIYEGGGHVEIVKNGLNGFLWKKKSDLINKTRELINNPSLMRKLSDQSKEGSKKYSYNRFEKEFGDLL